MIECVDSPDASASAERVRAHPEREVIDCINSPLDDEEDEEDEKDEEDEEDTCTLYPTQVVNEAATTATAAPTAAPMAAAAAGGRVQHGMWRCVDEPSLGGTCMRDPGPPSSCPPLPALPATTGACMRDPGPPAAAPAAAAPAINHGNGSSSELIAAPPREQQQQQQQQQRQQQRQRQQRSPQRSVLSAPTAAAAAAAPKRRRGENEPAHEAVAEESNETIGGRSKHAAQLSRRPGPAACEAARSGAARAAPHMAPVACSALRLRGATAEDSIELDAD